MRLTDPKGQDSDGEVGEILPELHDRAGKLHGADTDVLRRRYRYRCKRDAMPGQYKRIRIDSQAFLQVRAFHDTADHCDVEQATGYGSGYYTAEMIKCIHETFAGKTALLSPVPVTLPSTLHRRLQSWAAR